ncbi:MAG TPA: hydroxyethylthiazole kinase [Xanthobacteraceae bacterium]
MSDLAQHAGQVLALVRERKPRVHCITNTVVQGFTANILLAAGAIPSMTTAAEEIANFVAGADALLVNLGTFDPERRDAVGIALEIAAEEGVPWVLDPVLIERSPQRAAFARTLTDREPRVVRANEAEFAALIEGAATQEALDQFAISHLTVAARTGAIDLVTDGSKRTSVANGHALMARVTGIGCAESALIAALLAVEDEPFGAAVGGLVVLGIAGEIAAEKARGPGSFAVELVDALAVLDTTGINTRAKLS